MKKAIMIPLIFLLLLSACTNEKQYQTITEWSDGSCKQDKDCQAIEYGCGGDHIVCTNNTQKWENAVSTCEVVMDHPSKKGFSCKCLENQCLWLK